MKKVDHEPVEIGGSGNKHQQKESSLRIENISFWDGVSIIVGSSIGAGILSLAFGARQAGFPVLVFWIIVAGIFTTISMLYLAETTLRTKKQLQLSGLAQKYIGNIGSWLMFAAVFINSLGALIAYTSGSGDILSSMLGIPNIIGSLLFFIPSLLVVWLGLKVTGATEKVIVGAMIIMVLILILATLIGPGIKSQHLSFVNIGFAIPVFSLTIFTFISQYTVPELARGYARGDVKRLPRAIITGMTIIGILLILVPMSALGLSGPDNVSEIATIAWAQALGQWAFFVANIFTLCAFITSFWAIGGSLLTNIVDKFNFSSEWNIKYRLISIAIVALPPFIIAYTDVIGFVDVLSFAGAFAGVIMGILPVMMLNRSRTYGEREPEWTCGWIAHPIIQALLMIIFVGAAIYTFLQIFSILPSGW